MSTSRSRSRRPASAAGRGRRRPSRAAGASASSSEPARDLARRARLLLYRLARLLARRGGHGRGRAGTAAAPAWPSTVHRAAPDAAAFVPRRPAVVGALGARARSRLPRSPSLAACLVAFSCVDDSPNGTSAGSRPRRAPLVLSLLSLTALRCRPGRAAESLELPLLLAASCWRAGTLRRRRRSLRGGALTRPSVALVPASRSLGWGSRRRPGRPAARRESLSALPGASTDAGALTLIRRGVDAWLPPPAPGRAGRSAATGTAAGRDDVVVVGDLAAGRRTTMPEPSALRRCCRRAEDAAASLTVISTVVLSAGLLGTASTRRSRSRCRSACRATVPAALDAALRALVFPLFLALAASARRRRAHLAIVACSGVLLVAAIEDGRAALRVS